MDSPSIPARGQATIPRRLREAADLREGDRVRPASPAARAGTSGTGRAGSSPRLRGLWIVGQILGRALLPHHVVRWMRRRRTHRRVPTAHANAQLLLYNRMLPGDFLHYGYFDDPDTPPEEVSFAALHRAQLRYARKLAELVGRPGEPVLDAGSGMGGMLGLLRSAGHDVTGLTPDRFQVEHIRRAYPGVPVLHCRFEDMCLDKHKHYFVHKSGATIRIDTQNGSVDQHIDRFKHYFGTVIHSESIQYMRPEGVFSVMRRVLAPGGTWIVADYFRRGERGSAAASGRPPPPDRSGWRLDAFRNRLRDNGFEIASETDITAHVLPTLGFARLLAERIGLPALDFAADKLRAKSPGLHYVVENVAEGVRTAAHRGAAALDPSSFAARKRYLLMSMRRG